MEPGEVWLATYEVPIYDQTGAVIGTALRQCAAANLEEPAKAALGVRVAPTLNVAVTAPTLAELIAGGAIGAADTGILIVSVASDISAIMDQVDGSTAPATIGAWAAAAASYAPPGGLVPFGVDPGEYVEISILASTDGKAAAEVETLPEGLTVDLELTGLDIPLGTDVALWALPTSIIDVGTVVDPDYIITNTGGDDDLTWGLRMARDPDQAGQPADGFFASLSELSLFGAFKSIMAIYDVYPNAGPANVETAVRIEGDFGIDTDMTLAQVEAAFAAYFGDTKALFDDSVPFALVAAANAQYMYVVSPALPAGVVDVRVEDVTNPTNVAFAPDAYTYVGLQELTVNTAGTGGGTTVPAGAGNLYTYNSVAAVSATANADSNFVQWQGDLDPGTNAAATSIGVTMDAYKTVTAVFDLKTFTLSVTVLPNAAAGTVTPDPVGPVHPIGQSVSLLATANAGYTFDHWEGAAAGPINPTSVTMDADKAVTAVFVFNVDQRELVILPSDGGSVVPDPSGLYNIGTVVPLVAVADAGYSFLRWEGDVNLGASVNPNTVTMDTNQTIRPVFIADSPAIAGLSTGGLPGSRAEAWLFGGVIARITGQGFKSTATVTFDGQNADIVEINSPTDIYVVVPALQNTAPADKQFFYVDVVVTNPPGAAGDVDTFPGNEAADTGFRYKRYETAGDVTSTAFQVLDDNAIDLALNGVLGAAKLTVPGQAASKQLSAPYGIARASKNPADVFSNLIASGAGSATISNIWDFAVHLYENTYPLGASLNTQALGVALYPEVDLSYTRCGSQYASLEFPVADTTPALTAANVQAGLTLFSLDSDFDYGTGTTTATLGSSAYQSTLIAGEAVDAADVAITAATDGATVVDTVVARIYDFSAFSLRARGLDLPDNIKAGVQLDGGTASGPAAGGTALNITAPNGGFEWVQVAFGDFPVDGTGAPLAAALGDYPNVTPTNDGLDECSVAFTAPAYTDTGITNDVAVDIAIYLDSNSAQPVVVLQDVYTYKGAGGGVQGIWLILLGLAAALIGIAAGGDSGGGGGGPCFIATAAYGTPMATEIDTLRAVRDTYLLNSAIGTAAVDTYYRISPAIADVVAKSPFLATVVRIILVPVVYAAKLALAMPPVAALLLAVASLMAFVRRFGRAKA
ncbi:MAG: hypothetical protein GWP08_16970 [Nitrospiraceae bacterium]|nr:hypothetical protein [Nitrospiraceae bacterium]